jgi:ribosomal protein S18 acetylase RimI-like enzyme
VLDDGAPCGYLALEDHPAFIAVREIVIAPAFQGRGIGSFLLRQVLDQARERHVAVRVGTLLVNRAAALYRRLGFRETGRTPTHILFEWTVE